MLCIGDVRHHPVAQRRVRPAGMAGTNLVDLKKRNPAWAGCRPTTPGDAGRVAVGRAEAGIRERVSPGRGPMPYLNHGIVAVPRRRVASAHHLPL